jgi:hypothetical protein
MHFIVFYKRTGDIFKNEDGNYYPQVHSCWTISPKLQLENQIEIASED